MIKDTITFKVEMPPLLERRYLLKHETKKRWYVYDSLEKKSAEMKSIVFVGNFKDTSLACLNLNKKHYKL